MNGTSFAHFQLNPNLSLRGWSDIACALQRPDGAILALPPAVRDAIELAWAGVATDSPILLPTHREALAELVRKGMGRLVDRPAAPLSHQRYRRAECRYVASLHWSITGLCNMRCRHCFIDAPDAAYGELPLADCVDIMDQMVEANIASLSLTGGEPLVRPDWREFYAELKARRLTVTTLYTNGLLITEQWLDGFSRLEPDTIGFSLSFDGIGHHDWLRGREGMERRALDAIRLLTGRGYPVEVETALYRDNLPSIPDTCELLHRLGVRTWKLSEMSGTGAWLRYAARHSATADEIDRCCLETLERFEALGRPFSLQMDHRYLYMKESGTATAPAFRGDGSEQSLKRPACSCARLHPYLLPDATLAPCMPLSNRGLDNGMPNLKNTRLVEVLNEGTDFFDFISLTPEEIFRRSGGPCSSCEHRLTCCGGCRARAYALGDLYGRDPELCAFFKSGTKRRFERFYTGHPA